MCPELTSTSVPSFILIHPTVWPQYSMRRDVLRYRHYNYNSFTYLQTDRRQERTDRHRSDTIGRTVLQTVAQKRHGPGSVLFDDNGIFYVLPVLWMTSRLPIIGDAIGVYSEYLRRGRTAGEVCCLPLACCTWSLLGSRGHLE